MIHLLKKLVGNDTGHKAVDSEFRACLSGVDGRNRQLEELNRQLDEVLAAVSQRQSQISPSAPPNDAPSMFPRSPRGGPTHG